MVFDLAELISARYPQQHAVERQHDHGTRTQVIQNLCSHSVLGVEQKRHKPGDETHLEWERCQYCAIHCFIP